MNDWKTLEHQLRAWTLRPPSARIRRRLFSQVAEAENDISLLAARHWLAPALAVCVVALTLFQGQSIIWPGWQGSHSSNLLATVALNQPLLARYYAPSMQHDRNTWSAATFDWTNGGHALTSAAPKLNETDLRQ